MRRSRIPSDDEGYRLGIIERAQIDLMAVFGAAEATLG